MRQISRLCAEQVKSFSANHDVHTIEIRSTDANKATAATYIAQLTQEELARVCDFITDMHTQQKNKG